MYGCVNDGRIHGCIDRFISKTTYVYARLQLGGSLAQYGGQHAFSGSLRMVALNLGYTFESTEELT